MMKIAREAAITLAADGYDVAIVNPRFTKPLDEATTAYFAEASDAIVTLEDHVLPGGYGSSVIEVLADRGITTSVLRIGWPDQFIEHASSVDYLRNKYGLTTEHTVELVRERLGKESAGNTRITAAA
jgi:1-deoxy-D-xylulose-5-phosphate synthase